jgi:hypothetical protein
MRRLFKSLVPALAVVGLTLASPAFAAEVPHKEKSSGTINTSALISPTVAFQAFSGTGLATQMGAYTQTGSHKANLVTGEIYDGEFTSVAADGSTISGIYFGSFTLNPDGSATYKVTALWLEGTGRLEGVTGSADVVAVVSGTTAGSTYRYTDEGTWILP